MRFLQTADWHLGRVLHGASLIEDQAHLLDQFVDLARPKTSEYREALGVEKAMWCVGRLSTSPPASGLMSGLQVVVASCGGGFLRLMG